MEALPVRLSTRAPARMRSPPYHTQVGTRITGAVGWSASPSLSTAASGSHRLAVAWRAPEEEHRRRNDRAKATASPPLVACAHSKNKSTRGRK